MGVSIALVADPDTPKCRGTLVEDVRLSDLETAKCVVQDVGAGHLHRSILLALVMGIFGVLGCGKDSSNAEPTELDCLGSTQASCVSNDGCTVVLYPAECPSGGCEQLYVGCLPVGAGCAERDEALCALADGCLKLYSSADEFLRCDTEVCETDADCAVTDGYACFDGFIDGLKRCRHAPIECSDDTDCPMEQVCEFAGEMTRVCVQ